MPEEQGGYKLDAQKLRWDLLPWDALEVVAAVLTFGEAKYTARGWEKGIDYHGPYRAAINHLQAFWRQEDADGDSGLPHLALAACEILFLLAYQTRGMRSFDDRPPRTMEPNLLITGPDVTQKLLMDHVKTKVEAYHDRRNAD